MIEMVILKYTEVISHHTISFYHKYIIYIYIYMYIYICKLLYGMYHRMLYIILHFLRHVILLYHIRVESVDLTIFLC